MHLNNYIQIVVIILSGLVLYLRFSDKHNLRGFKNWYGAIFQIVLILLYIRELSISDLSYKKWYWFFVDFALAFYFYLRIKENKKNR